MKFFRTILILTATLALVACSSNTKQDPYHNQDPAKIYLTGHKYMKKGDYNDAISAFEALEAQYPFNKFTKKGDIELLYAYYKGGQPELVIATANRFIRLYPTDKHVSYAYYMAGVVDFNSGRGFLQRYFPYNMNQHHPLNYENAFKYFQIVVTQYPKSPYAPDAKRRMIYLKNTIAAYYLNIAKFYYKREAYVAAINRAKIIILHYPRSTSIEDALQLTVNSYNKLGLTKLAATTQKIYDYNFAKKK